MKKLLILMVAALMVFSASPGWAAPVLGPWEYTSPIDSILAYDYLATASDAEEQAFVADVLNITTEQLLQTYGFVKVETPFQGGGVLAGSTALSDFNPGFSWVYAVVKVDGPNDYSYLFVDDNILPGGDDRLNTPSANTLPFNMIEIGELVFVAARERKETRGKHIRVDYPFANPLLQKLLIVKQQEGKPTTEWRNLKRA